MRPAQKMKFLIGFLCASFLWILDSAAQMELRGRLITSTTKAPIYSATVFVLGTELMGKSNEKGEFTISSSILPREETLTIVAYAYQFESKVMSYPLAGSAFTANVEIELDRYMRQTASEDRPSFVVSGHVVDEMKGGLPSVNIMAANIRGEAFTNRNGEFDFRVDQIRPIDQTELWFSKPGYVTKRVLLPALRKKRYTVKLDSAVILVKSRAKPSQNLTIKFVDADNRPLPGVALRVDGKSIGETDLLGFYHLTFGENAGESIKLDYFYKFETSGSARIIDGDTLIWLNTVDNLVKIQIDPFHQTLWVKTYGPDKIPLRNVKITAGNVAGTTDISGKLRLKVTNARGELVAAKAGFAEARIKYEIKGGADSIEIVLDAIPPEPPPKKFIVAVLENGDDRKPVPSTLVQFGNTRALANKMGEVVFENPKFPDTLTARNEGFEDWSEELRSEQSKELPKFIILFKRKPTAFGLTPLDSTDFFFERPQENPDSKLIQGKIDSSSQATDNTNSQKKFANIAGFIGPAWWRFAREDTSTLKPPAASRFSGYLEISFSSTRDDARLSKKAFRAHLQMQSLSLELINLDLGFDFLWRPSSYLSLIAGLRGTSYDLQIADMEKSWLTPFFSLGIELRGRESWFQRMSLVGISLRNLGFHYSHDDLGIYHIDTRKFSKAKNLEAPRQKNNCSFVIKTNYGALRAGYYSLAPHIRAKGIRLQDISMFFISYGFDL